MNIQLLEKPSTWQSLGSSEATISERVEQVLRGLELVAPRTIERRKQQRYAFPQLLTLTPVRDESLVPVAEPIVVVGKHLSSRGLNFYHRLPLPFRRVIVSFDDQPFDLHVLMVVSWCRFLRPEWYDSGGKFTHLVTPS